MTEPLPIRPDPIPGSVEPGSGLTPRIAEGGPAFKALLDKLELQAADLAQRDVAGPEDLAGAVDSARASLEDVLSLKEQLLEAFRQAQSQAPDATDGAGGAPGPRG